MSETKELRKPVSLQNLNSPSSRSSNNGTRIGPYLVGKTLGVGSTGRVKLGTHIETGNRVAIKIIAKASLLEKYSKDPVKQLNMNQKLEREITLMKLIQHPNIMQLYDVYETDRDLYLILEHIEGGELFDYLVKRGRLSEPEALGFFQQIIYGVDFCHRNHICHRDLKPENLLLDKNLNIKIADFGMASLQVPTKMLETSCGSPHYASPEIIKGIKYDGTAADVWSCGIILYALLTGNLPFDDENIRRLLSKVKTGVYYMPEYLSSDAKNLISRMLVVDPAKRIKMSEIMKHPWFTSIPPKAQYLPAALESVGDTAFNPDMLDEEILKSLHLIGWGDEEQLKEKLSNDESNFEKVFYALLLQRKTNFFENYDINKLTEWDIEGGPRRRTESYNSLLTDRNAKDIYKSSDTLISSPVMGSPSPLSSKSTVSSSCTNVSPVNRSDSPSRSSASNGNIKTLEKQTSREELIKRQQKNAVHVNSPLATNLVNNTNIDNSQKPSVPQEHATSSPAEKELKHHASNGNVYNNINISTEELNNHINTGGGKPKPLQINIPKLDEIKGGGNRMSLNLQVGTPRFHRRKADFPIPPSPVITSTPKKSWFANLFNFKPEAVTLLSESNVEQTSSMIQDLMESLEIKYQSRREGGFKCKWDGGQIPANVLAAAKGQVVGGREESTLLESTSNNTSNKKINNQGTSSNNVSNINTDVPKADINPEENSSGIYTTPTSAKTSKPEESSNHSIPTENSSDTPAITVTPSNGMVAMKSVKFKIDIIPSEENTSEKTSTRVIFTQQQGSYSSFQVVVYNIKSTWETCEKEQEQTKTD